MKRFHFQLETALEWRRRRMELEQARLNELEARKRQLAAAFGDLENGLREAQQSVLQSPQVAASDLAALESYRHTVQRRQFQVQSELGRLEGLLASQRKAQVDASRDFRLLEKLKHRRLGQWKQAADAEMEAEAGELYLAKWRPPEDEEAPG